MRYALTTFGGCSLTDDKGVSVSVPVMSIVMLAYLYDTEHPVSRRDLAALLWPGKGGSAVTNLRSMLRRFSAALPADGPQVLSVDDRYVSVNRPALSCDMDAIASANPVERLRALCEAVSRRFLPGPGVGSRLIDTWVRDVRARLAGTLRLEFFALCASSSASDVRSDLKRAAVLLLEEDPHDDEVRNTLLASSKPDLRLGMTVAAEFGEIASKPSFVASDITEPPAYPPRVALLPPVVLPYARIGGAIANALIEDLTIGLCASRAVSVVAPYTSERIRASKDSAAALQQHNVIYALDTKRTDEWLFAQLIFMPTDEVVWATRFRLDAAGVSEQRLRIAEAIQASIIERVKLSSTLTSDFNASPEAYFSYLRGLQSLSTLSLPSVRRARRHFKEAVNHQRGFAAAMAGVSRTLSMEWILTARGDEDLLNQAELLAIAAIREDKGSASAFKELGVSQLYLGKIDDSLFALSEAENLSPHYADVLCSHADSLTHGSNPKAALEKITSAIDLNPISPDAYFWTAAGASYFLGEYQQAIGYIDRMRESNSASRLAAACWGMLGETAKARACRNRVLKENPDFDLERWLVMIPHKESWQTELYREGLVKAGF